MSDFFTVKNIIVEGNHYFTVSQIVDMAQIPTGYNLFKTDTSTGKDALLAEPYITLVDIKQEYFPKVLQTDYENIVEEVQKVVSLMTVNAQKLKEI